MQDSPSTDLLEAPNLIWLAQEIPVNLSTPVSQPFAPLKRIRAWLDSVEVTDREMAQRLCELIPAQCPFERRFTLWGRTILYIPPLCKLNPFYDQFVALRFRALCYLADVCGEDISAYC